MAMWILTGVLGVLGLVFLGTGLSRFNSARIASGAGRALGGGVLVALSGVAGLTSLNLHSYSRLVYEQNIAELSFEEIGTRLYRTTVTLPGGTQSDYELLGDAWQLDARVLKFHPWANVAGYDAVYRLDRLSGRYDDVGEELSEDRRVHALTENPGIDIWEIARDLGSRVVDASYGSGTYLPMRDGARFEVQLTQSGLVARPLNDRARDAVDDWR